MLESKLCSVFVCLGDLIDECVSEAGDNQLSGSIPDIGATQLRVLDLSSNELSGEIPLSLAQLRDLVSLCGCRQEEEYA